MNNFEAALNRIKELEEENAELESKLKVALWGLKSTSVEGKQDKPVEPVDHALEMRMKNMETESKAAMQRFTKKLRVQARKHREQRNGKDSK